MRPHGTISRYTNGRCRCEECRIANKIYQAHYKGGQVSRDLVVLDYTVRAHLRFLLDTSRPTKDRFSIRGLARHLGIGYAAFYEIQSGRTKRIMRPLRDRIMATSLFDLEAARSYRRKETCDG